MKDDEEFGKITIDDQPENPGWNKPVPYIDSWRVSHHHSDLTKEQKEFYAYLKECVTQGKYLSQNNVWGYLPVLAQELAKTYKRCSITSRPKVLQQIINMVTVYKYRSYDLGEIVDREQTRIREQRLNSYNRIHDKAFWVEVGQPLVVYGWELVRGGFYWGKFVDFNPYNPRTEKFGSTTKFEGPAISLIDPKNQAKLFSGHPNSYWELNPQQQHSLLSWLAGSEEIDIAAMALYLAGFEVRLFGDKTTPESERIEDIRYLYRLLGDLPNITGDCFKPEDTVRKWITNIIDFTLARYFIDIAQTVLPEDFVDSLPILVNARIDRGLANIIASGTLAPSTPKSVLIENLKKIVRPPRELPEVFHQAFYDKLASEYQYNSRWHFSDYGIVDTSAYRYNPIDLGRQYEPEPEISRQLNVSPYKYTQDVEKVGDKLKLVYARIMRELSSFRSAVKEGAPLFRQANLLPGWLDRKLMPGVENVAAELSPAPGEKFKLMKVSDVAKYFTSPSSENDSLDEMMVDNLRSGLYQMGLSIAYPRWATVKLKLDDTAVIYKSSNPEVPGRGTLPTSMVLAAWMVQAEKVSETDYQIIDQWLDEASNGAKWELSAQAVMRWLIDHKLTMTAKRKARSRVLARYANKRDQLQELLLLLVNGDGFVLPKRMKRLETIYELLGLDPSTIHSDLHRLAIEGVKKEATASPASSKTTKGKAKKAKGRSSMVGGMINRDKLKEMEQSTAKAQEILSQVFIEPTKKEPAKKKAAEKKKKADSIVTLIKGLAQKEKWTRAEFEKLFSSQGETYGAMLEKLNDYSYDKVDEALVEDDGDTVYVDIDVANQLLELN